MTTEEEVVKTVAKSGGGGGGDIWREYVDLVLYIFLFSSLLLFIQKLF